MDRPHLLLVTGSLECGGSERQIADMANYWAARSMDVTVATSSNARTPDFYELDRRIRRVHLDVPGIGRIYGNLQRVGKLRRFLIESQPDAVVSFLTRSNVPTILAGLGLWTFPCVVSSAYGPETGLSPDGVCCVVSSPGRAIAIVRAGPARLRMNPGELGKDRRTSFPMPCVALPTAARAPGGADPGYRATPAAQRFRSATLFGFFDRSPNNRTGASRILGLAGRPERVESAQAARRTRPRRSVEFPGHVQDVESWMSRAGLVVQPSRFEGFPNAVLESMGMGAAVISANCPAGPAELIEDGVNGRLVPVDDVFTLARVMEELMVDPAMRARFGREAQKVRERYCQESIMARWEAPPPAVMSAEREMAAGARFEFGENWSRFSWTPR